MQFVLVVLLYVVRGKIKFISQYLGKMIFWYTHFIMEWVYMGFHSLFNF